MTRDPAVAGQFYPAGKQRLIQQLDGMLKDASDKTDAIAAVVPHAGYMYSGSVAGEVYSRIEAKETYIIISPNHTGYGSRFAVSSESWNTPLGEAKVDEDLLKSITEKSSLIQDDPQAHIFEHSVEVQVPFIQRISCGSKILPITVQQGSIKELQEVSGAIASSVETSGRKTAILSSSDMTHYESRKSARVKDRKAIDAILQLDAEKLIDVVEKENISMCGYVPTSIMLMAAKKLGAVKAELVKYTDSAEVTGDEGQVVGYAGMIIS